MLTRVDRDEWWPVYGFDHRYGSEVTVPDELVQRWERIKREFEDIQAEIEPYYDESLRSVRA